MSVLATNDRTLTSGTSTTITINIINTNDNRPEIFIDGPIQIDEDVQVDSTIGFVLSNDTDNSGDYINIQKFLNYSYKTNRFTSTS